MLLKKIKAFTLTEMVMTIAVIGILMAGMTVYIGGSDMKRKIIEAQGCASSIGGELTNYVFYALTSKSLRLSEEDVISPDFYHISLNSPSNINCSKNNAESANNTLCDSLDFSYSVGNGAVSLYKNISIANTCRQNQANIRFYWNVGNSADENNIKYITMNKGFSPITLNESNVFYLVRNNGNGTKPLVGDIVVVLCIDDDCSSWKEVSKFIVDGRTQTISLRNCGFYSADNPNKCEEREN